MAIDGFIKPTDPNFWSFEAWLAQLDDDAPDAEIIRVKIGGKWRDLGTYGEFRTLAVAFRTLNGARGEMATRTALTGADHADKP